MSTILVKLAAVSICPCGAPTLHGNIALGTEYRVYTETIRRGFVYVCGTCGEAQHDVAVIEADNRSGSGRAPLPLALFDLILVTA